MQLTGCWLPLCSSSSQLQPLCLLSRVPLNPWPSPQFASQCRLHGWTCGLGLHPCHLHNAASNRLLDPSLGGTSCPELSGRMLALYLLWHPCEPLQRSIPTLKKVFILFHFVFDSKETFLGCFFHFLTCSSTWEHHHNLEISSGIHHLDLSLSPPHIPISLILSGHREQG